MGLRAVDGGAPPKVKRGLLVAVPHEYDHVILGGEQKADKTLHSSQVVMGSSFIVQKAVRVGRSGRTQFVSGCTVTLCTRGSPLRDARPARNEKHIKVRRCRRMSTTSRAPPAMTRDRENPGRARAPCRDRSRDASLLFFGGSSTTVARVSRGAGSTRARRARAGSPENPPDSRDRAPRVVRGGRYAARGVVTHATIIIINASWTLVLTRHLFLHRPRARETRDAPSTAEARLARRRRVPRVSRAIPRRPPHRHPVADRSHPARLSHDRAANSSDRAEVRASRVESRSETRRA